MVFSDASLNLKITAVRITQPKLPQINESQPTAVVCHPICFTNVHNQHWTFTVLISTLSSRCWNYVTGRHCEVAIIHEAQSTTIAHKRSTDQLFKLSIVNCDWYKRAFVTAVFNPQQGTLKMLRCRAPGVHSDPNCNSLNTRIFS